MRSSEPSDPEEAAEIQPRDLAYEHFLGLPKAQLPRARAMAGLLRSSSPPTRDLAGFKQEPNGERKICTDLFRNGDQKTRHADHASRYY
jgi:hypothetical protein